MTGHGQKRRSIDPESRFWALFAWKLELDELGSQDLESQFHDGSLATSLVRVLGSYNW
jgi:hypothetical protein